MAETTYRKLPQLRDMRRFPTTADRLAAWRACSYRKAGERCPSYFGAASEATMLRDERGPRLNYGDGLGVDIDPLRPFRFLGWADEVCRSIQHTGWFADGEGFDQFRGVVFQIPARRGQSRYLAGAEWGKPTRRDFGSGAGWVDCSEIYDTPEDAAHAADDLARIAAESAWEEWYEQEHEREEAEEAEEAAEGELRELVREGVRLMPLGTAKRADWVRRAAAALSGD